MKTTNTTLRLRGWNGKLNRINALINEGIEKEQLTKADITKYNRLIKKYFRFHNDGDIPKGTIYNEVFSTNLSKREMQLELSIILEKQLTELFSHLVKKYYSVLRAK